MLASSRRGTNILFGHSDINYGSSTDFNAQFLLFTLVDNVEVNAVVAMDTDFDDDGDTDLADLMIQQRGYGVGSTNADGDTNADFAVDSVDLANWKAAFTGAPAAAIGAVPEPGTATLFALGLLGFAARRRS